METDNTIWLAGDCEHPDFAAAADWLRCNCQCVNREASPAAIVVFQSRPDSVSRREVESWHRRAPLTQLTIVTGPWCDGERLGSKAATGVTRIRWHQWRERLPQELSVPVRLPRTASDGDRLEQALRGLTAGMFRGNRVSICTDCRASYDVLADACQFLGLNPTWQADDTGKQERASANLLLIDGWRNELSMVPAASATHRILLLDFPRPEDARQAAELGFAAVIAQPLMLPDLVAVLRRRGFVACAGPARVA